MPRRSDEPAVFFPDLREQLSRIYEGHWIGVEDPNGAALPFLMRIDRSANGEHLACTALVIAAGISSEDPDPEIPRIAITQTALRDLKLSTLLDYLEQHPKIGFPRAFRVRDEPHPGRGGLDDSHYRRWAADYRWVARNRKRQPKPGDMPDLPRSTFYRYRQEAIRRGFLKEDE